MNKLIKTLWVIAVINVLAGCVTIEKPATDVNTPPAQQVSQPAPIYTATTHKNTGAARSDTAACDEFWGAGECQPVVMVARKTTQTNQVRHTQSTYKRSPAASKTTAIDPFTGLLQVLPALAINTALGYFESEWGMNELSCYD